MPKSVITPCIVCSAKLFIVNIFLLSPFYELTKQLSLIYEPALHYALLRLQTVDRFSLAQKMQFIPPVPYRSRQRMLYAGSTAFRRNLEGHDQSRRRGNHTHHATSAFTFTVAPRVPSGDTRAKVGRVSMPTTRHRELLQQSVSTRQLTKSPGRPSKIRVSSWTRVKSQQSQ